VRWRPLFSGDLFALRGRDPFRSRPPSYQYEWACRRRDAERWADYYGLPYREPDAGAFDPRRLVLAATAAARLGAVAPFSRCLFQAVIVDGVTPLDDAMCARWRARSAWTRTRSGARFPAEDRSPTGRDGRGRRRPRRVRGAELRPRRRCLLRQRPPRAAAPHPAEDRGRDDLAQFPLEPAALMLLRHALLKTADATT
jgi:hypothetical protein